MRASGNGNVIVCAQNLLRTFRGEVPCERVKGLDPRMIDKPTLAVIPEVQQDARWLLETYEPRAEVESINVVHNDVEGGLTITANINGGEAVSNG